MTKPLKLSPSSLNLFKDCTLCFWMQFNKGIKHPSTIFPSLPSGMDRILKNHFDSYRERKLLPPELKQLDGDTHLFEKMDLLTAWRNNLKGIKYIDEEVGATLRGAIDEMLINGKKLIVLDFKTRGFPLKEDTHDYYQDQLDIYSYLLEKNGFETEDYAYLLFFHPECVNGDGSVKFISNLVKMKTNPSNAEKLFRDAVECLQGEMPSASDDCGHCGYVKERG